MATRHITRWQDTDVNIRSNADAGQLGLQNVDWYVGWIDNPKANVYYCQPNFSKDTAGGSTTYLDGDYDSLNIRDTTDGLLVAKYIKHLGNTNTLIEFHDDTDRIQIDVGGVTFIDMVEGATDYIDYFSFARIDNTNSGMIVGTAAQPDNTLHVYESQASSGAYTAIQKVEFYGSDAFADGDGPAIAFHGGDSGAADNALGHIAFVRDTADNEGRMKIFAGTDGAEEFQTIDKNGDVTFYGRIVVPDGDWIGNTGQDQYISFDNTNEKVTIQAGDSNHKIEIDKTLNNLSITEWVNIVLNTGLSGAGSVDIQANSTSVAKFDYSGKITIRDAAYIENTSSNVTTYWRSNEFEINAATVDVNATTTYISGDLGIGPSTVDRKLHVETEDATTNAVLYIQRLTHTSSGSSTDGFGVGVEYEIEATSYAASYIAAKTEAAWEDEGLADAEYRISIMSDNTPTYTTFLFDSEGIGISGNTARVDFITSAVNIRDGFALHDDGRVSWGTGGGSGAPESNSVVGKCRVIIAPTNAADAYYTTSGAIDGQVVWFYNSGSAQGVIDNSIYVDNLKGMLVMWDNTSSTWVEAYGGSVT